MNNGKVTFKTYIMGQASLLPPSWDEMIPGDHLVRVVDRVIEEIDIRPLLENYKGGGTSSYHPRMMLKVIVYAYAEKVYSCRRIAKALRENVNFMWIAGGNRPDFRTINTFRSETMKEAVRAVFTKVMELLIEEGYIRMENYFVDGTKIEASANAHKVVWAKKTKHYKEKLQEKIEALLDEIEQVNQQENLEYGDADLEEMGEQGGISSDQLRKKVNELNAGLKKQSGNKALQKAVKTFSSLATVFINKPMTPPALFHTWNSKPSVMVANPKTVRAMRAMAAKRIMPGWKKRHPQFPQIQHLPQGTTPTPQARIDRAGTFPVAQLPV